MTTDPHYREEESSGEASGNDEPSCECEDDRCRGEDVPVWHCVDCDSSYCRCVVSRLACMVLGVR